MISIILPTFNEQDNLKAMHERLATVADTIPEHDFEFIFVDDCSRDKTPQRLTELANLDKRIKLIRFARNCGSHAAVAAGLHYCRGEMAIMLASDLQDPPEIISKLLAKKNEGYNVVWGLREKREGEDTLTLVFSRIFYHLMNRLTDVAQSSTGADIFLIDRQVIDTFKNSPEKNTSVYMLIAWFGFAQTSISYVKKARQAGTSKWTTAKRLKLFLDSLISFSYLPLRFMSLMGFVFASLGLLYGIVVLSNAFRGLPVEGWASLMIVLLFIGGFQMIMMGMLGEYIWRTYDETRGRLRYVIEKTTFTDTSVAGGPTSIQDQKPQGQAGERFE